MLDASHHKFVPAKASSPIGVFDSGVGGLSVFLHLQALLPHEQFLYYADTKNVPYGNKSSDEIIALTHQAVAWLIEQGAKMVVVACNSASAYTLDVLRQRYATPIVGLVPAIKPATLITQSKQIAVLATRATLLGKLMNDIIHEYATPHDITVHKYFEPTLVPWVELGMPKEHDTAYLLIDRLHEFCQLGIDTLVLGCTHYPFFREFLQSEIDTHQLEMTLIDSGLAIAHRVKSLLEEASLLNHQDTHPPLTFFSTDPTQTQSVVRRLIDYPVKFV